MNMAAILVRTRTGLTVLALLVLQALNMVFSSQGMPTIALPAASTQPGADPTNILTAISGQDVTNAVLGVVLLFMRAAMAKQDSKLTDMLALLEQKKIS